MTSSGANSLPRVRREGSGLVILVVALGGALGSVARWGVGELVGPAGDGFPWATFLVNATGALAVGAVVVAVQRLRPGSRLLLPFLATGMLGGFTTFSAFAVETRALLAADQVAVAVGYLLLSLGAGLLAVVAASAAARRVLTPTTPEARP